MKDERKPDEIKWRPKDDPEYCNIKEHADFMKFADFMKGKYTSEIRLPLNNPEAYQYLRWLNEHFCDCSSYLNFILNIWDSTFGDERVRPPTPRELATTVARHIVELADDPNEENKGIYIDFNAEYIRDAYYYWSFPQWISSGLAGCILKWGTFEDNEKPGDEKGYVTYEEWYSNPKKED